MKKIQVIVLMLCAISLIAPVHLSAQCAMCGASVQSSDEGLEMAAGLNAGILYLLLVPYVIFMTFAIVIYKTIKRKKQQENTLMYNNKI